MMAAGKAARGLTTLLAAALFWLCMNAMLPAQTNAANGANPDGATVQAPLDFDAWAKFAGKADKVIADTAATEIKLMTLRAEIADWRARFLAAQGTNAARIGTLRSQIEALGPLPAEGTTEPADIRDRRKELAEQLAVAQAPSIAAVEAYSRADGLIREIDGILRERQADALLQLWPSPLNPANWPGALTAVLTASKSLGDEVRTNWVDEVKQDGLWEMLLPIGGLLLFAAFTILRGRALIEGASIRLMERGTSNAREIWAFVASLGEIIVPTLGAFALSLAITITDMPGPIGLDVALVLFSGGFAIFVARWLGTCSFPKSTAATTHLGLISENRAKGRFLAQALGVSIALEQLRIAMFPESQMTEAAAAVLAYPTILLAAFFLFRMGKLLVHSTSTTAGEEAPRSFSERLIGILGRAAVSVAIVAILMASLGYIRAAQGIVFPMIISLGLVALLFALQNLVGAIYAVVIRNDERGRDALIPVLVGFFLAFAATPVLALIWGARVSDLTEVFTKLRDGFQIGATRISPSDFILLAVVFGFWFLITRLLQGALKTTILPKTNLDQGGQNAIVAGVGYIGIFLAALIGITAAGIDLSGLAIVAGALSVGLGFGLQNIVSNFVSGIILLIERPISEGDWIEVNGVMGTVRAISVRSTRIQTFDRTDVIVPNSDFISGMVTNWTRFNLSGRLIVKVGVAYGTDTRKVAKILQEIAEAQPLAVLNPPPAVVLMNFGADSLDFEIRVILRDVNFSVTVRSEINHEIARRFVEEGIEIPFGQRDIWIRNPEALAQMVQPPRAPDDPVVPIGAKPKEES